MSKGSILDMMKKPAGTVPEQKALPGHAFTDPKLPSAKDALPHDPAADAAFRAGFHDNTKQHAEDLAKDNAASGTIAHGPHDVHVTVPNQPPASEGKSHTEATGRTATMTDPVSGDTALHRSLDVREASQHGQPGLREHPDVTANPANRANVSSAAIDLHGKTGRRRVQQHGSFLRVPGFLINLNMISQVRQDVSGLHISSVAGEAVITNAKDITDVLNILGVEGDDAGAGTEGR